MFSIPKSFIVFLFFLTSVLPSVNGQMIKEETVNQVNLSSYIQEKHGPDQEIINGRLYYNKYYRILNHPFYNEEYTHNGSATLSGKRFPDVMLKYDIYKQCLILEYLGTNESRNKIFLSPDQTDAFELGEYYFEKLVLDERDAVFYQVIGSNSVRCFIHWRKEILVSNNNTKYAEFFSDPKRIYFAEYNEEVYPFRNRKTFASPLSGITKREISKYMRSHSISFRDASPEQLESLLKFVSDRIQSTSGN